MPWTEVTVKPGAPPEIEVEPDGTFLLHWPGSRLTVLLDREDVRKMSSDLLDLMIVTPNEEQKS